MKDINRTQILRHLATIERHVAEVRDLLDARAKPEGQSFPLLPIMEAAVANGGSYDLPGLFALVGHPPPKAKYARRLWQSIRRMLNIGFPTVQYQIVRGKKASSPTRLVLLSGEDPGFASALDSDG